MNRTEFLTKMASKGLSLSDAGVYLDEIVGIPFTMGLCEENGKWKVYENVERNTVLNNEFEREDEAYDYLYWLIEMRCL